MASARKGSFITRVSTNELNDLFYFLVWLKYANGIVRVVLYADDVRDGQRDELLSSSLVSGELDDW